MIRKPFFIFLLILLLFHIGLVIPKTKFECSCHGLSLDAFSPCCNCPNCVSQRGGFLSACGCHEKTEVPTENLPSIKRAICFCGSSSADFDLPGAKYPVLLCGTLFMPSSLEIHYFIPIHTIFVLEIYLTPPEHPS